MGSTLALIALGSNLGDRSATLDRAIAELANSPGVVVRSVSRYLETAPVGGPGGQGAFLNAAATLETTLDPFALYRLLIDVERRAGRVRDIRWDSRTLDLDLILFGDQLIDTPELIVPHPRFAVRRFVMVPMAEIAPHAVDPVSGRTVLDLLANLDRRPSYLALSRSIAKPAAPAESVSVFSVIIDGLNAAGTCEGPWVRGRIEQEYAVEEEREIAHLQQLAWELDSERWGEAIWGERWIVTDFWLGDFWFVSDFFAHEWDHERSRLRPTQSRSEYYQEALRNLQARSIQPTFVLWMDDGVGSFGQWFERSRSLQTGEFDAPVLRVRSAAYRQSREHERSLTRGPEMDSWTDTDVARYHRRAVDLKEQYHRDAIAEALAACEASRAGFGTA